MKGKRNGKEVGCEEGREGRDVPRCRGISDGSGEDDFIVDVGSERMGG